jgi:hypothetical protein
MGFSKKEFSIWNVTKTRQEKSFDKLRQAKRFLKNYEYSDDVVCIVDTKSNEIIDRNTVIL